MVFWTAQQSRRGMKILRHILGIAFLQCTFSVFGQATVNFFNDGIYLTPADRLVRDNTGHLLVGTNYLAQLYYGAPGSLEAQLIPVASLPTTFRLPTTMAPGTWIGAKRTLDGFSIPGQEVTLQVRVWDVAAGSTWEDAMTSGFGNTQCGSSVLFAYFVPNPQDTSPWRDQMDNLRGFSLVPEPSILGFAVVGAFGLWLCGRRSPQRPSG